MIGLKKVCREVHKTESAEDGSCRLKYTLTRRRRLGKHGEIFSITVALTTDHGTEERTAYDIARTKERAEALFGQISRNGVTPCTLVEVLSEIL